MLDLKREWFKPQERFIGRTLGKLPITPNQWTFLSIVFALIGLCFVVNFNFFLALLFFLISGVLDFVDGSVARAKNMASKTGAYIDTIVDRYVEGIMFMSLLFVSLPVIMVPASVWICLSIFGSIVTTYAKAAAKEKVSITPDYRVLDEKGPDHRKNFVVGVFIGNSLIAKAKGTSKHEAEVKAAEKALIKKNW
jgi:phosphatidylglycerophosphate synthase